MCSDLGDTGNYYSINGDPLLYQIGAKVFLENLTSHMDSIITGNSEKKVIINFSHDTIVGIMLSGLGVDLKISPPYAAAIFFELWEEDGEYFV